MLCLSHLYVKYYTGAFTLEQLFRLHVDLLTPLGEFGSNRLKWSIHTVPYRGH